MTRRPRKPAPPTADQLLHLVDRARDGKLLPAEATLLADGIKRLAASLAGHGSVVHRLTADLDGASKQLAEVDQRCDGYFATIQRVRDVFAFGEQAIATVGPDAGSVAALVLQRLRLAVDGLDGPEHCNRCHGNEDGPCHEPEHVNGPADDSCCPGCRTPAVVETAVPDAYERDADGASWRTTAPEQPQVCRRCLCPAGAPQQCEHCNCCDVPAR